MEEKFKIVVYIKTYILYNVCHNVLYQIMTHRFSDEHKTFFYFAFKCMLFTTNQKHSL